MGKKKKKASKAKLEDARPATFPARMRKHPTVVMFELLKEATRLSRGENPEERMRLSHYIVLAYLAETGASSQKELSDALRFNASDLVGVIDALEGEGYVERTVDANDRRRHALTITRAGHAAMEKRQDRALAVEAKFFAMLTPKERATMLELLVKALDHHLAK